MTFRGPFQSKLFYSIIFYESAWYAVEASVRSDISTKEFLFSHLDHIYFIHGYLKLLADMLQNYL